MKVGLQLAGVDWPGGPGVIRGRVREIARVAEEGGFSDLWAMDHVFQVGQGFGDPHSAVLEGYSLLAFLASVTHRVRLGLLVTCPSYRPVGLLAKTVTTLDVLSGGRAWLGIGAGWYEYEARALGLPLPPRIGERTRLLGDTLRALRHAWADDRAPFVGATVAMNAPVQVPRPLTRPHPPVMLGMDGERVMPRLAARYADAVNLHLGTPLEGYAGYLRERYRDRRAALGRKVALLREQCAEAGRDPGSLACSALVTLRIGRGGLSPSEIVDLGLEVESLGIGHLIINLPEVHDLSQVETIAADVIPTLRGPTATPAGS